MTKTRRVESLKNKLGMKGCFATDLVRKRGGLALFWKDREAIQIQTYSHWHMSAKLREGNKGDCVVTGFYGHPDTIKEDFLGSY